MNEEILMESERILNELDRIGKFGNKYRVSLPQEEVRILDKIHELGESIPDIETPKNQDELVQAELKRRLTGDAFLLEQRLSPRHYDFDTVVSMYGIPAEDINGLRGWLESNREETLESIDRLYQTKDIPNLEFGLSLDIPSVRKKSEKFATKNIGRYHKHLGRLLQDLTGVGNFFGDIDVVPTDNPRSYFNPTRKTLAIGIPAICSSNEDGSLNLNEMELIRLYGHEGMGHAVNEVLSKSNGLPHFLTGNATLTTATAESVAQFYQDVIFDDLKNSQKTQRALGIQNDFEDIYADFVDTAHIQDFQQRLGQYAISVLGDRALGDPNDPKVCAEKVRLLNEVAIDPSYGFHVVEGNRSNFDSEGNLNAGSVAELRYCAQPVQRALEEFFRQGVVYEGEGRKKIDETFLKGFWTPTGFVDNARLKAEEI